MKHHMKYVMDISDFYQIYEAENSENKKADDKKVKAFFKKNWKLILIITGLTLTGLTIYFLNRNKIKVPFKATEFDSNMGNKAKDVVNNVVNSPVDVPIKNVVNPTVNDIVDTPVKNIVNSPVNVPVKNIINAPVNTPVKNVVNTPVKIEVIEKMVDNYIDNLNVPAAIKTEFKKELDYIPDVETKRVILSIISDIDNPNLLAQVEELDDENIGEILGKSKDRENFIENLTTAIEQNIISYGDIHPKWKNDIQKEMNKRTPVLTHDMFEIRKKILLDNGINFKDLSQFDQKLLQTPHEQGFLNKLNALIAKKEKFKDAGIEVKQIKGFDAPQRIKYLNEKGIYERDLTKGQLTTFKTCSVNDFVDYVANYIKNLPQMKEDEWQKKLKILNTKGIKIDDFDDKTVVFLKSVNMETFNDYIRSIKGNLDKSIDDFDIKNFKKK